MHILVQIFGDQYLKVLSKWASVSRTLNTAASACRQIQDMEDLDASEKEKYGWCEKELDQLTPALDHLHQSSRTKMWQLQGKDTVFFMVVNQATSAAVAVGMGTSIDDMHFKANRVFSLEGFSKSVISKDEFEFHCQEGKLPIFP